MCGLSVMHDPLLATGLTVMTTAGVLKQMLNNRQMVLARTKGRLLAKREVCQAAYRRWGSTFHLRHLLSSNKVLATDKLDCRRQKQT